MVESYSKISQLKRTDGCIFSKSIRLPWGIICNIIRVLTTFDDRQRFEISKQSQWIVNRYYFDTFGHGK